MASRCGGEEFASAQAGGAAGTGALDGSPDGPGGTAGASGMAGKAGTGGSAGAAGMAGRAGASGAAGIGGFDGGAGTDGGMEAGIDAGAVYIPSPSKPSNGFVLPPTRAFLAWKDGLIPAGKTITGYEVCFTTGALSTIDDPSECPNQATPTKPDTVIDPLTKSAQYFWKVRTCYNDSSCSDYSAMSTFSTDDSLVLWIKANEGSGTTAADSSGLGNNGTLQGSPTWVAGIEGQALQFNGTSNYVLVGDNPSLEGMSQLTVEAWVRTTATATNRAVVGKWNGSGSSYILRTDNVTGNRISFSVGTSASPGIFQNSTTLINDAIWHHVAGTYDGALQKLFVDGVLENVDSQTGLINTGTQELCIGDFCTGSLGQGLGLSGLGDEVAIYNIAHSLEVLVNNYCSIQTLAGISPLPALCIP